MSSLPEIFAQTSSPDPQIRRRAESNLHDTINNNPECSLDSLRFASDWGNHATNGNNENIVYSRLAAAIFIKNMIVHSSWGSGMLHHLTPQDIQEKRQQQIIQQQQNQNNNNAAHSTLSPSQMFGNFLPPPQIQQAIRDELIRAMVNWKNTNNNNNNNNNEDPKIGNVEETILRYIQSAAEAIHDVDWPRRWSNLLDQALDDFSSNALPACFQTLSNFTNFNNNNNNNSNFFSNEETQSMVIPLTNALNRGSASLCVVKLCCKRMYDPESSDAVLGVNISSAISKNRSKNSNRNSNNNNFKNEASEELLELSQTLLGTLGQRVFVPFVEIINNPAWSRLLIHSVDFAATQMMTMSNNNNHNMATALLQNFQRAWTTFCYEGLKAVFHLAQTQIYGALLEASVGDNEPFLFALVQACTKLHHALFARTAMFRETVLAKNNASRGNTCNNNNNNNVPERDAGVHLLPENLFFHQDDKREGQVWRLWKRIWALLFDLFDHYGEQQSVPKKIRNTHRQWVVAQFAPVLSCALGMSVLHENRPAWSLALSSSSSSSSSQQNQNFFSFSSLNQACANPGQFSISVVFASFVESCAREASQSLQSAQATSNSRLLLAPFYGAQFRANSDAANYAVDLLELSVKFTPWIWWDNALISPDALFGPILAPANNFPSEIVPLFRASVEGFTQTTGALAWFLISWIILPRQAITCDEVESWEINPVEYMNSKNDANTELYNLKSSYSRLLAALLTAREGDGGKNNSKNKKNKNIKGGAGAAGGGGARDQNPQEKQANKEQQLSVSKHRVQLLVDWAFQLLAISSNELFTIAGDFYFDVSNPHPAVLAADSALQIVRLCRHAVMERGNPISGTTRQKKNINNNNNNNSRNSNNNNDNDNQEPNDVEAGLMMQGLLPLLSAKRLRFGPLRAKAAQVVAELCAGIQWSGASAFQMLLTAVLDLMYDEDIAVRMQVCSSLSPLIRHPLAGTVVVPHLVKIVQQFFDVLAQNQNEIVILTLRKLFAHYREHMSQWAVDLARIILERFEHVVAQLLLLENEENPQQPEQHHRQSQIVASEFSHHHVAGAGAGSGNRSRQIQAQQQPEQCEREISDLTAIGDELLGAISTVVKCVPRPSSLSSSSSSSSSTASTSNSSSNENARRAICDTACALQELLCPMIQNMFDSPNSMGFFEGGLKLLSVLLRRSEFRVLPATWNVFSSLFRIISVRNITDYFCNMIAVLDNFVSADPAAFMMHRQDIFGTERGSRHILTNHPGENQTFAGQACEMLKTVCEKSHIPIQDVANAIQCIDCFVLNGARCLQNSVIARYAPDSVVVKNFSFDEICASAQSSDPLHLREFLELPVIVTSARRKRLPRQAADANLLATPSLCVLLANSIFCCTVAASPQAICSEAIILQRALLSFSLVSRLFDEFSGIGSGEYRKVSDLAQQPAHFRIYDRKLFILALSHFIGALVMNEEENVNNNNNNNNSNQAFFSMMEQEGYAQDAIGTFENFLKTALMMAIESAYFDCRMLLSLRGQSNEVNNELFQGGGSGGGENLSDDDDNGLYDDSDDDDNDDDDDEDTDVTTDEDFLEGIYDGDDDDDDDEDGYVDDDFGGGDDDEGNGRESNHHSGSDGGISKHTYIQKLAAEAARMRGGDDGDDEDDEEDDFNDNLLVEDPNAKITTPIDDIDEYRVLGEVLERVMSSSRNGSNFSGESLSVCGLISAAISKLSHDVGGFIPVCRPKVNVAGGSKKSKKKRLHPQSNENSNNSNSVEMTFAFVIHKNSNNNNNNMPNPLPVPEFLRQCSQQRSSIDNFV